jgi:hypothetical protein
MLPPGLPPLVNNNGLTVNVFSIPEPSTCILLGIGGVLACASRQRMSTAKS